MTRLLRCVVVGTALAMAVLVQAAEPAYKNGQKEALEISVELIKALDKKYLGYLKAQPLKFVEAPQPILRLADEPGTGGRKVGVLVMSTGFIELLNRVAHAKAIDRQKKGYFLNYIRSWPVDGSVQAAPPLPDASNPAYWSDEMIDQQTTFFYQMAGVAMGIQMANFYLGQYEKYAGKLAADPEHPQPLNRFLAANEWQNALAAGVKNALDCAYGISGIAALYECVDGMPKRPEWTLFFIPEPSVVKVTKLKSDLTKLEKQFFGQGG